jgi:hypothetical protein
VIDNFVNGTAISYKTINLFAQSYQRGNALFSKLTGYVDKLAEFPGGRQGNLQVKLADIEKRVLEVIVPKGGITQYQELLQKVVEYARK